MEIDYGIFLVYVEYVLHLNFNFTVVSAEGVLVVLFSLRLSIHSVWQRWFLFFSLFLCIQFMDHFFPFSFSLSLPLSLPQHFILFMSFMLSQHLVYFQRFKRWRRKKIISNEINEKNGEKKSLNFWFDELNECFKFVFEFCSKQKRKNARFRCCTNVSCFFLHLLLLEIKVWQI